MADALGDTTLDSGLTYLDTLADTIHICSAEPTSYANVATVSLGNKSFSPGAAVGSPATGAVGRKVTTVAVTGGTVTATGTATKWALVDSVNSKLLFRGSLNASRKVVAGDTFSLNAVDIVLLASVDAATTAWAAAVVTAGGTVSAGRKTLVDALIVGLKADGVWSKLDRLWILAAENSQSALIDLVALNQASAVNTPTFTTDRGYTGDGSTSYIDTTFNASTQGVNYTLNSAHMAIWDNTNRATAVVTQTGVSAGGSSAYLLIHATVSGANHYFKVNDGPFVVNLAPSSSSLGMFVGQRINSTTLEFYYNGTSLTGAGLACNSNALVNRPFPVCGLNNSGTYGSFSTDQISMASYGGQLTATDNTNFYNRLRTYMTAVGVS